MKADLVSAFIILEERITGRAAGVTGARFVRHNCHANCSVGYPDLRSDDVGGREKPLENILKEDASDGEHPSCISKRTVERCSMVPEQAPGASWGW